MGLSPGDVHLIVNCATLLFHCRLDNMARGVSTTVLLLALLSCCLIGFVRADPEDQTCPGLQYRASILSSDDGYKAVFENHSPDRMVGYVEIHWSVTRFGESRSESIEFHYRMKKAGKNRFEHMLRFSDADGYLKLGEGDILRYYFTYWVLPPGDNQGHDCQTNVKWFASPAIATGSG